MLYEIDHADVVTCHICNKKCPYCVDKFLNSYKDHVKPEDVEKFMKLLRRITNKPLEVLLLGGEPTCLSVEELKNISDIIRKYHFRPIISTNGKLRAKIIKILQYFDWVQITINSQEELDFWGNYENINVKLAGDESLTLDKFNWFIESSKKFKRRSISMYSTEDFHELCTDKDVWDILDTLEWHRNGSYLYAFYKGVRIKKFIKDETNIIDEPTVPKLYPNGNYNKTWNNEDLDEYLGSI